jgi:hypothetical protein
MQHVLVLFRKVRIPFFELEIPTSEEIASLRKPAPEKISFHVYKFNLAGE